MNTEIATFAGGCFWCIEGAFNRLNGVHSAVSGYMGGHTANPDYQSVCSGQTGHAEVVRLHFDPSVISLRKILAVFFAILDPTKLNRQGNDIGTQYRSVIFFHTPEQRDTALAFVDDLEQRQIFRSKVVTEISPLLNYFPAEKYHQEYFENNPMQPYCAYVVAPKVEKAEDLFADLFKR